MTEIQVVPNSGHHFYWIPFNPSSLKQLDMQAAKELERRCQQPSAWATGKMSWVRYKFSMDYDNKGNKIPGIFLAIESNLGDVTRGSTLVPATEVPRFDFVGQPEPPYAFRNETEIVDSGETKLVFDYPFEGAAEVRIRWTTQMATAPIPVDLIVDFGNTRTVAILLEETPAQMGSPTEALRQMVRPVRFMERSHSFSISGRGESIIDSWFVLQEPQFQEFEPPKLSEDAAMQEFIPEVEPPKSSFFGQAKGQGKKVVTHVIRRVPQMFVELSPIALGVDAPRALRKIDFNGGGVSFLSSPKRYAWDNRQADPSTGLIHLFWTMVRNDWDPDLHLPQNALLACQVLRFFPYDGSDWPFGEPPTELASHLRPAAKPVTPAFPRADALAWMALAVIETAYRQMNSAEYWKQNYPYVRRKLRSVQVTFPSGWTTVELNAYKSKWEKAVNTFAHGHLEESCATPTVEFPIDEAIASQLPIIFSEIQHMHGDANVWLSLLGRVDNADAESEPILRAMTLDIGGGTTDYSVVEYRNETRDGGILLNAQLLFKDSTNIAGDGIVRFLIERVLLPKLGERFSFDDKAADLYESFFRQAFATQNEKELWKRITRLVFVPRVTSWLSDMCAGRDISISNFDLEHAAIMDSGAVDELNRLARDHFSKGGFTDKLPGGKLLNIEGSEQDQTVVDVTFDEVARAITDRMGSTIISLSKFVASFDVDLVIVSGKPSELPTIRELVSSTLPITRDRIICAKDYYAGDWYPFNDSGKITDGKTVTAIGLALYKAIENGRIPGWAIRRNDTIPEQISFYWLGMPRTPGQASQVYLQPDQDTATVELMANTRIGRRLLPSSRDPEPTYIFRWINPGNPAPNRMAVTLERLRSETGSGSEELLITQVKSLEQGKSADIADVSLDVCTLSSDEYWLDNPRFAVVWPANN